MSIQNGKLLYHLTTLDVFESIVINGLLSRSELNRRKLSFVDTANHEILEGRKRLDLSEYIPFHFHIHTAYDTVVKGSYNKEFIYLRLSRTYAFLNDFKILPIHPTSNEQPKLYSYLDGFNKINWEVMEMTNKEALENNIEDRYHKQVRMAECLSPRVIPIEDFQSIVVPDNNCKNKVCAILKKYSMQNQQIPFVDVDVKGVYF